MTSNLLFLKTATPCSILILTSDRSCHTKHDRTAHKLVVGNSLKNPVKTSSVKTSSSPVLISEATRPCKTVTSKVSHARGNRELCITIQSVWIRVELAPTFNVTMPSSLMKSKRFRTRLLCLSSSSITRSCAPLISFLSARMPALIFCTKLTQSVNLSGWCSQFELTSHLQQSCLFFLEWLQQL